MDLKIGIASLNPGWKIVLDQEGICYEEIDFSVPISPQEYSVLIIDEENPSYYNPEYLRAGGTILFSAKAYSKIFEKKLVSRKKKKLISDEKSDFSDLGIIDLVGNIKFPNNDKLKCEDSGLKIYSGHYGEGFFYIIPFELNEEILDMSFSRRKFIAERNELPSEIVSRVSKSKIRNVIKIILRKLHDFRDLPFVQKTCIPDPSGTFIFRIDTDFCSQEEAVNLLELCRKHKIKATWFVDTVNKDRLCNVFAKMDNQEIGLHCYRHLIFDNYKDNFENVQSAISNLKKCYIDVSGFSAPFGSWNYSLNDILEEFNFIYSSEFVPSYDDLPFFIYYKKKYSNVLQIPIHPISLGRLRRSHFSKTEMITYYTNIIIEKKNRNEPIIIYHHPHHKMLDVIDAVFSFVNNSKISNYTMKEYALWWKKRDKTKLRIKLQNNELIFDTYDVDLTAIIDNEYINFKSQRKIDLSGFSFHSLPSIGRSDKMHLSRKFHWRDLLYNCESWKGRQNR